MSSAPPAPSLLRDAIFYSSHHVALVAAFLSVDELITASALSASFHAIVDGEAVWREWVKALQASPKSEWLPTRSHLRLARAEMDALPPLPSRVEVAALCVKASVAAECRRRTSLLPQLSSYLRLSAVHT